VATKVLGGDDEGVPPQIDTSGGKLWSREQR